MILVVSPSLDEIEESLTILGMAPANAQCAYCGDKMTEWDHLRPLVIKHRPTGFISEIANLVPSCGKCNQSKGNKPWRNWIRSSKGLSPSARGIADVSTRISRLDAYEKWRSPTIIDFEAILGPNVWNGYWLLWEQINTELRKCQDVADSIRNQVIETLVRK